MHDGKQSISVLRIACIFVCGHADPSPIINDNIEPEHYGSEHCSPKEAPYPCDDENLHVL